MKRWLNFTFEVIQIMMLSVRVLHQSRMKYENVWCARRNLIFKVYLQALISDLIFKPLIVLDSYIAFIKDAVVDADQWLMRYDSALIEFKMKIGIESFSVSSSPFGQNSSDQMPLKEMLLAKQYVKSDLFVWHGTKGKMFWYRILKRKDLQIQAKETLTQVLQLAQMEFNQAQLKINRNPYLQ